jgi:D-alanine-D-alanine ligase
MQKFRIAVLRGGPSEEYDVSMKTGSAVLSALDSDMYEPVDIIITKGGEWLTGGYTRYPEQILHTIDIAFLALHGAYGEDGTIQKLLDKHGVKYTGSKSLPSRIAMHKPIAKNILKEFGVKMPSHMIVTRNSESNLHGIANTIAEMFGPEYIIKPIASGSSVGVLVAKNKELLPQMLKVALEKYDEVLVEAKIKGKEATCGVIERFRGEALYALPPIEVVPPSSADFFDTTVKYDGSTDEICPGRFSHSEKSEIERVSKLVHSSLGLSQYSRSDFIVGDDGGIYFLEVNTLPGLTNQSLFPKAISSVGGSYNEFIAHLLTDRLAQ